MTGRIPPEGGDRGERQIVLQMLAVGAFLLAVFVVIFGGVR